MLKLRHSSKARDTIEVYPYEIDKLKRPHRFIPNSSNVLYIKSYWFMKLNMDNWNHTVQTKTGQLLEIIYLDHEFLDKMVCFQAQENHYNSGGGGEMQFRIVSLKLFGYFTVALTQDVEQSASKNWLNADKNEKVALHCFTFSSVNSLSQYGSTWWLLPDVRGDKTGQVLVLAKFSAQYCLLSLRYMT